MNIVDLQFFGSPLSGKQLVYLWRVLKDATSKPASLLAFTTENTRSIDKKADSKSTKDGSIRTPGTADQTIECKALMAKDSDDYGTLEEAMLNDELIELWEVNRAEPEGEDAGKYKAKYFQGYLTSMEISSPSDDFIEVSLTFGVNGAGKDGYATLTTEQEAVADYVFEDTTKEAASGTTE